MIDGKTMVEAYVKRCEELEKLLPKWTVEKAKYEQLDNRRLDMEADIRRMRELLEDADIEKGAFHDQLAHDFSIEKYGRNKRYDPPKHGSNVLVCYCEVQCPICKKYEATVRYVRRRYGDNAIIHVEVAKGRYANGLYYCEECGVMA